VRRITRRIVWLFKETVGISFTVPRLAVLISTVGRGFICAEVTEFLDPPFWRFDPAAVISLHKAA
jgi:hypothetical protein